MGFADLCLNLKITYGSPASIDLMDEVMGFIRREAWTESLRLGAERGVFPELEANREAYAKFIYDDSHVEFLLLEFPQKFAQQFRFGHEGNERADPLGSANRLLLC